jgi:hypothetical protein
MYTTCLFCQSDLGKNEAIESFPVGRRLAFDAAQGRLWVVCRKCERWNLTPLDERWEAVEQCERLFTSTRMRVSTDNIGLSRLSEGLELVRIGKPQRPEMAAWRYGDQFGKRRRRYVGYTVGAAVVAGGIVIAGPMLGFSIIGGGWGVFQGASGLLRAARDRIIRARVALPGIDRPIVLRGKDMKRIVLGSDGDQLSLRIPNRNAADKGAPDVSVVGSEALRAASMILPGVNHKGGRKEDVQIAVSYLEATPDPKSLFMKTAIHGIGAYARGGGKYKRGRRAQLSESEVFLDRVHPTMLLALEMAAHEDIERRAMEGELAILEAAWRQAEEIAAISDNLLPSPADEELNKIKMG